MARIEFFVPGKPQGKARPRWTGKGGRMYTPQKTKSYEKNVAERYRINGGRMLYGPICVAIIAYFRITKSWNKAKKVAAAMGKISPGKPDADNIIKIVLDGLNKVAYEDDQQVVVIACKKVFIGSDELDGVYVEVQGNDSPALASKVDGLENPSLLENRRKTK